jgi:hypothetical protein
MPGSLPFVRELQTFAKQYGPAKDSEHAEEWMIRDFYGNKRDGVFLDIGANDYKNGSNTYYLERELGWSGLAVEPLTQFAADYARYRPRKVSTFLRVRCVKRPSESVSPGPQSHRYVGRQEFC